MTVNVPGIIVALVSVAAGGGAMVAAPSVGLSEANAMPFGLLVGGVVACLISWHQTITGTPNSIFLPIWVYGTVAAVAGLMGMVGLLGLTERPAVTGEEIRRLEGINDKLKRFTASGSSRKGSDAATRFRGAVADGARKMGGGDKTHVYVDLGDEGQGVKAVGLYVRAEWADRMKEGDKKSLLALCMKLLQTEFPRAACGVALRGPGGWEGQSYAKGASMPAVTSIGTDPPRF